ncbi:MAG: hypothetical protein DWQ51_14235 [Microcystis wesenbergii TW10]|uniref:Uncharacterized protein n=3 Tax=Microcystis TaxID=1125 RepID=A0A552AN77_MICAE|nr:MAG: hypothetical protein DWQ51_14235 [Microcystis wesenbergii TW10]TRT86912.1 MAG: hypothetical protein EWV63_09790 [Microcystis aeruginosa Ma_OC_H_19870700_S124]TRU91509.1 MAG: hypothetical protein EWV75_22700 [Microcystis wesenbergii Mw_QC_S_20081001_S30D]TRU97930.1 MAG: hypothetical protein EWV73_15850 [Microcystis wesenbergii Mw_QC_B_20070930_S4D]TRU97985.1 MAG: hypothetical protein EWV74_16395 [Microcystis wesenbergii Mw_QC_S_20081001_S30]TRV17114.1 MAG: hypothetical protein EWV89_033
MSSPNVRSLTPRSERSQESGVRRLFLFVLPTPYTPHPTPHFPLLTYPDTPSRWLPRNDS